MPPAVRINSPATNSERHKRFVGAHPYPNLPRSRLPYLRALLWLIAGSCAAVMSAVRSFRFGRRRAAVETMPGMHGVKPDLAASRKDDRSVAPRVPSLTPF